NWGKIDGGAGSHERTTLSTHFPGIREFNREILRFWAFFSRWCSKDPAQSAAFISDLGRSGLEMSREFSQDIRELKFPVTGFEQRKFLNYFAELVVKTVPNSHY